jgi:hypothetical protein
MFFIGPTVAALHVIHWPDGGQIMSEIMSLLHTMGGRHVSLTYEWGLQRASPNYAGLVLAGIVIVQVDSRKYTVRVCGHDL